MITLDERVEKLAQSDISILIIGESGTGKELVARSIHTHSTRERNAFIAVNCGGLSESMIDSELFGHSRGAFTGAIAAHRGMFVEADGGTLFLDEIGEMPLAIQTRLLRVLQEHEVRAVGGDGVRHVDVRIVAATNRPLLEAVAEKRFRADLYYRLSVATIEVPPLRARMHDVPGLAHRLMRKHHGSDDVQLATAALAALMSYRWPGNVRELENALLHALALRTGDVIDIGDLPSHVAAASPLQLANAGLPDDLEWAEHLSLADAKRLVLDNFERRYVTRALERACGNLTEAAARSGLERSNFRRVLHRLGIDAGISRQLKQRNSTPGLP